MKRLICALFLLIMSSICVHATTDVKHYNLYKTDNMYTFLKLNTQTGQIWQVHWSLEKDGRAVLPLSTEKLSSDTKDGRFSLFPTTNMYNFILIDTIDGRTWQVQWSFKEEARLIVPIQIPSDNTSDKTLGPYSP